MCVICLDGRKSLDNEETYTQTHTHIITHVTLISLKSFKHHKYVHGNTSAIKGWVYFSLRALFSMSLLLNYKKNYDYKFAEGSKNIVPKSEKKYSRIKKEEEKSFIFYFNFPFIQLHKI